MAIQRAIGTRNADSSAVATLPSRTGSYLEAYTLPMGAAFTWFGDEGSFYHACNATVGTGIAGHAAPVVADTDTKALLHLYNSGTKNIIPVYLTLEFSAIGAGGNTSYSVVYVDDKGSTARTSGGTAITPVNVHSEGSNTTGATIYFGAVVTSMTSSRMVFAAQSREVIPVIEDKYTIMFGSAAASPQSGLTLAGTATANFIQYAPPVVVGPGGNLNVARIRASQSGADSYRFSFGYIER